MPRVFNQYLELCKPRVVVLIVFTAVVGMFLAVPGWPPLVPLLAGTLGIALAASSASTRRWRGQNAGHSPADN